MSSCPLDDAHKAVPGKWHSQAPELGLGRFLGDAIQAAHDQESVDSFGVAIPHLCPTLLILPHHTRMGSEEGAGCRKLEPSGDSERGGDFRSCFVAGANKHAPGPGRTSDRAEGASSVPVIKTPARVCSRQDQQGPLRPVQNYTSTSALGMN